MQYPVEFVIEPRSGWQPIFFQELWHYRDVLWVLMWRDIKIRYRQTVLGGLWAVLQPLPGNGYLYLLLPSHGADIQRWPAIRIVRLCRSAPLDILFKLGHHGQQ